MTAKPSNTHPQPVMTAAELNAFLAHAFPEAAPSGFAQVGEVAPGYVRCELPHHPRALRPGGVISGPTQMSAADTAMYALVLAHVGEVPMAVTTSLTMHFLRPCRPGTLVAEAKLLRLGRRIATGEVSLWTEAPDRPASHAVVAYALPQD